MNYSRLAPLAALACLLLSTASAAEDVNYAEELTRKVEAAQALAPLGSSLLGDETNWNTGTTTFRHVDVDIPGNNALPVQFVRTTSTAADDSLVLKPMGTWDIEVPYISTLVHQGTQWSPSTRCSAPGPQPDVLSGGLMFLNSEYWRGYSISIPGHASGAMLKRDAAYMLEPTDEPLEPTTGPNYPWVAAGNIQITCGVALANGTGEGFLAVAPDGTRWRFDRIVTRLHGGMSKPDLFQTPAVQVPIDRDELRIYATSVVDRFGNSVSYNYDASNRLESIESSDGRRIEVKYEDQTATHRITKVVAIGQAPVGNREWNYSYSPFFKVKLPDDGSGVEKFWSITTPKLKIQYDPSQPASNPCNLSPVFASGQQIWTITHPSGATGSFTFTPVRHERTVPFDLRCKYIAVDHELNPGIPTQLDTYALTSKTLSGPGLTAETWTASYGTNAEGKVVTQTNPDSTKARYTFGTEFYINEGKLLRSEVLTASSAVVRNTLSTLLAMARNTQTGQYECPTGIAYACRIGSTMQSIEDSFGDTIIVPTRKTEIAQDGMTFTSETQPAEFDQYARSTKATKTSGAPVSLQKVEQVAYYDRTSIWVVGQVASVTVDGIVASATDYHADTGVPLRRYSFGKLMREFSYNTDGTLAQVTDGTGLNPTPPTLSHTITLSSWKRGLPQTIQFPVTAECAGSCTQTAVVDDAGWIRSATNEKGNTTTYQIDAMGRITRIIHPVGWLDTVIGYQVVGSELGLPANLWRRQETTGTFRERTYYDARLRPLLKERMDTLLPGEAIYQKFAYDYEGREKFASYPSDLTNPSAGINTTFDALGRTTQRQTDLGVTLESVAYPAGKKAVTDANGNLTTVSFQMFDAPSYEVITQIAAPEGQTTEIWRDVFGNMTSAKQSGYYQGSLVEVTRSYVYDQHRRLCKRIEPETNQRVIHYDVAGNVDWSADGQIDSEAACDYEAVIEDEKTEFTYDARNRVTFADAPGTDADVTTTYELTGDVSTLSNATGSWLYSYNNRRMLDAETLSADALAFTLVYRYNPQGVMDQITYPSDRKVTLSPDALGRSRTVADFATGTNYATNIAYHPSGAISGFSYGNGLDYEMTLDSRLRPARLHLTAGSEDRVDLFHTYDAASNITSIIDTSDVTYGMDTRQMAYDGLHRLKQVSMQGIFAQDFTTAGAQSTSIPQGVTNLTVSLHGGGGGGGKHNNAGGGGGAGALCGKSVPIEQIEWGGVVNFTVGSGGASITSGTASTLVRTFEAGAVNLSAGGGAAGSGALGGAGGVAGAACVTKINGQAGSAGGALAGGKGGDSPQGGVGGAGSSTDGGTGTAGAVPGGGGGGGGPRDLENGILAGNGGAGGKGRVRLEWNVGVVTYDYDPLNNLRTRGGANPLAYGANSTTNRLDTVTGGLSRSYSYNDKGQVESDGTGKTFTWNGADRIIEVGGSNPASYRYDGLGKRIKTTKGGAVEYTLYSRAGTLLYSYKPANGESTDYVYLGSLPLAELKTVPGGIEPEDARNPSQASQVVILPGLPPQLTSGGVSNAETLTTYLHSNLLGSPIQWSGSTDTWMASEHYEAYGHKLNGVADKLGYTGHAHDFETDLTYMQARFYDPQVGRFLSADPVEFGGANLFAANRYAYGNNNPYKYRDPNGKVAVAGFIVG